MDKKYIVGVDFGHGETAAWVVPLEQTAKMESCGQSLMIRRSKKNESEKKIDSVVYIGRDGSFGASEGECPDSTLINEFKGRICKLTDCTKSNCKGCTIQKTCKKFAYRSFIRMVYKRICELNKDILVHEGKESNFYFQIACPTNWEEKDKKEYIDFFNDALSEFGVQIDYLMNESDAAYFCFNSEDTPSPDKVVLVIDYGSSTIDYTVVMGDKKISDDQWSSPNLGASEIEKTILSLYMSQNEDKFNSTREEAEKILIANDNPYIANSIISRLEYAIRKQKENYYTESHAHFLASFNLWQVTGIDELQPYQFIVSCKFEEAIKKYKANVYSSFEKLKDAILQKTNGVPVSKIILSGGASIMPWVSEYVSAIFGQDVVIEEDGDPGYVVAKGVAYYAQKRIEAIRQLIDEILKYSFFEIYTSADKIAYKDAVIEELNKCTEKLKCKSGLSGNNIREEFCKCLASLNRDSFVFASKVQCNLDKNITSKIANAIKTTMLKVFKTKVDTNDVSIHIDAAVLEFRPQEFQPGGNLYETISTAITRSSSRWNFTWDIPRDRDEQTMIVNGAQKQLNLFFEGEYVTYQEDALKDYITYITDVSVVEALRVFQSKDVFKSTYIG